MTRTSLTRRPTGQPLVADPFRAMERLFDDFLRPGFWSGSLLADRNREGLTDRAWMPVVDIAENEAAFVVTAELPGLTKDDVSITFENGVLTFGGERRFEEKKDGASYHRMERAYGAFSRSFVLPAEVDTERAEATFRDGLLTVTIPKAEQAKPRKIRIN